MPDPLVPAAQRTDAQKPFPFLQTEFSEVQGQFSPDGHWLAYASNESGKNEVYVTAFPGPGGKHQVSVSGGAGERWRSDGKELLYVSGGDVMAAAVDAKGAAFEVGKVTKLFKLPGQATLYDVSGDGQRFFAAAPPEGETPEPLTVVVNWPGGVKK